MSHDPSDPEGAVDVNFVMLSVGATRAIAQDYGMVPAGLCEDDCRCR